MPTKMIMADIEINQKIVKSIIAQQFGLFARTIRVLGEGWDNLVYLIDDQWVFRFPRRQVAVSLIEREMRFLPKLADILSLEIPRPIYFGLPTKKFTRPFYGHKKISGTSGCRVYLSPFEYNQAAKELAVFLKELHAIDYMTLELDSIDLEPDFNRTDFKLLLKNLDERFKEIEKVFELAQFRNKIDVICAEAQLYESKRDKLSLIHNDLYHRHLLFDEHNILRGVIDWGDCAIGYRVVDLGIVFQFFPKSTHDTFFSIFGEVRKEALDYARFLGLYYAIALLWFGFHRQDPDLIRTSLWTLNEL